MVSLLRERNFALLWFGGLISITGNWMLRLALPVHVYEMTGSTLATGATFIAGILPYVLLSSVAGVYVDRWDRRRTMIIANVLLAVTILPLLGVRSVGWLGVVYAVSFVQSVIAQFFAPAEHALLPQLVTPEKLPAANALNSLNNNLARLIGPALGGLLAGTVGLAGVVLVDAATYLVAAGMVLAIRGVSEAGAGEAGERAAGVSLGREWREGLELVRGHRVLALLFVMAALTGLGEGVMSVMFVPFVTEALNGAALQIGWLMSAQAIGGLIGAAVIGRVVQAVPPERLLGPSFALFGLIDLAMFVYPVFAPIFAPAMVLITLVGIPAVGGSTSFSTLMQTSVADRYRGRIFGAYSTTVALIMLLGMGLASALGDIAGVVPVISVQGLVFIAAGLLGLRMPSIYTEQIAREAESAPEEAAL